MFYVIDARLSFYSPDKLGGVIKAHKDILPKLSQIKMVYKICCKDCNATYVRQTSKQLKIKMSERIETILIGKPSHTSLSPNRLQFKCMSLTEKMKIF